MRHLLLCSAVTGLALSGCNEASSTSSGGTAPALRQVGQSELDKVLSNSAVTIVDFSASW